MMKKLYHILIKKAIFGLFLALFLCLAPLAVWAKIPNDPLLQKDLWNQLNAPTAWDKSVGSRDIVVAVIDVGVDINNADLRDNIWKNIYEIPGNGIDDDHNGYVDDVYGWNFIEENNNIRPVVTATTSQTRAKNDVIHHGTLIAGLIGGVGDNARAGAGVNWEVKIMGIRAMWSDGSGNSTMVARAVDYAAANGAKVINVSFVGDDNDDTLKQSLRRAYDQGVIIVAAAGNNGIAGDGDMEKFPRYPICYDKGDSENWIIGVSSVSRSDIVSVFADYGGCVDIMAPGENMASTMFYSPADGYNEEFGGGWNGNSFAAPVVAGAAALLKSIRPDWLNSEITDDLLFTADDIRSLNVFYKDSMGRGRLNIGRAVTAAASGRPKDRPVKKIFYISPKGLSFYEILSKTTAVAQGVDPGQVKDLSVGSLFGAGDSEAVMLLKYGPVYYARILKDNGEMWREIPVNGPKGFVPLATRIMAKGDDLGLLVEWRANNKKSTKFWKYNLMESLPMGQELFSVPYLANKWAIGADGNLYLARVKNGVLFIAEKDQLNNTVAEWKNFKDVKTIEALEMGNVFGGTGEQAVIIFSRGKKMNDWQLVLDLPSKSSVLSNMNEKSGSEPWHIYLGDFNGDGRSDIWRYRLSGGDFPVFSSADVIDTINVPILKRIEKKQQ